MPLSRSTRQVQPPLEFIPPQANPTVIRALQWMLPLLMRQGSTIRQIEATHVETLVDFYRRFQSGEVRFLLAFRHPSATDPFCLTYLLSRLVPQTARRMGVSLQGPIHNHFIYDRGIPLWAGEFVGWLYSRLGGTPIRRGGVDLTGLRSARHLFVQGEFPLAAAPEGATNGHNEIVSPLEPGISQMAFWCVEDLVKAGKPQTVWILPLGIQYGYLTPPWQALDCLLGELEQDAGLLPLPNQGSSRDSWFYHRLYRLGQHLLTVMEQFYTRFYHQNLPETSEKRTVPLSTQEFSQRLNALLDAALKAAEQSFNLQPKGSVIDRCRRIEQAGWDAIFREDIKQLDALSPLERGLADRIAEEANLRLWHMRLVESFVAVTGSYVREKPTAERFAETALLMWDMLARIKGENPFNRPNLGNQRVMLTIGEPISVSDRWDTYKQSRKGAKQAIADLTQDLQTALEQMARSATGEP